MKKSLLPFILVFYVICPFESFFLFLIDPDSMDVLIVLSADDVYVCDSWSSDAKSIAMRSCMCLRGTDDTRYFPLFPIEEYTSLYFSALEYARIGDFFL